MNLILAEEFARARHDGQKYGDRPYADHLREVVEILEGVTAPASLLMSGWLHDVIEDTDTTRFEVESHFGTVVGALVWAVSGEGKNRRDRMENACDKIRRLHLLSEPLDAATLKLADRLANVRECKRTGDSRLDMYRREQPKLREALAGLGDRRLWDALTEALA